MKEKSWLAKVLRWVGRGLWVVLVLFLGLVAVLLIREFFVRGQYLAKYPPSGDIVALETHDVHLHCVGEGRPVVVFESDLDQYGSLSWDSVQEEVGAFTRACSYDRAGIMWSEPGPRPRDGETIAAELRALLVAAGEEGPFVLVGHAFGGVYARIFAGENPEDVCGMVLLDSGHPDQMTRFAGLGVMPTIPDRRIRPLIWLFSHLGMPGRFNGPRYSGALDVYDRQQAFLPKSSMAWYDESVEANTTLAQAAQYDSFGDIPLVVLASARPTIRLDGQDVQELWVSMQQELTLLSTNSVFEPIETAGHYIQFDQPATTVEAIRSVVRQCSSTYGGGTP